MTSRTPLSALISVTIVFSTLAACSSGGSGHGYTEEIIDGVTVRTYELMEAPKIDPFEVIPSTVFGGDQAEDTYLLSGITLLGFSGSGELVTSDGRSSRFHVFAPNGTHLREFGRLGQGPGEFSRMANWLFDGAHIHIFDRSLRRRSILDLDGRLVSILRYPDDFGDFRVPSPRAFTGSGSNLTYLCEIKLRSSLENMYTYTFAMRDTALQLIETPIDTSHSPGIFEIGGPGSRRPPFTLHDPASALGSDQPLAWSWGREFRIEFLDLISKDRRAVIIPYRAMTVTVGHRDDYLERYYSDEGLVEEARRKLPWPSHFPHLDGMRWDSSGRLWVLEFQDPLDENPPWVYQVFKSDGTWLFQQELPMRIGIVVEDGMYVSETEEDGSPILRFYRFEAK
ncbi:6-bladed beta-propeller [Gemmatimonadota bacterium]